MFDLLDEKAQRFMVGAIFFSVFVLLLLFFKSYSPDNPVDPTFGGAATPTPAPEIDICDTAVLGNCEVEIKEQKDDCSNEEALRNSYSGRLSDPMNEPSCKQAQLQLSERCPKGCLVDYASVVVVPGKVRFDVFPAVKGASCRVRARRSVNMQGRCVVDNSVSETEEQAVEQ